MPTSEIPHTTHADVEADIADLPFRTPVIDGLSKEDAREREERVNNQWTTVTGIARAAILNSPQVREAMAGLSVLPLSESLPKNAIDTLSQVDSRASEAIRQMGVLGSYVALNNVPDEAIGKRLKGATPLRTKETVVKDLVDRKTGDPAGYGTALDQWRKYLAEDPGITETEKELVARRYQFGRDTKLLGLMAEMHDTTAIPERSGEDGLTTIRLESGTKVVATNEAYEEKPGLLNPEHWKGRRQLKDRVYSVKIGDESYIMKERKTGRHRDTHDNRHIDSLSAREEFETAKEFADLGTIKKGNIRARWEKPLGYAEFPDADGKGYEFVLFEKDPDVDEKLLPTTLAQEILRAQESYKEEFEQAKQRAKEIYETREGLLDNALKAEAFNQPKKKRFAFTKKARQQRKYLDSLPQPDELTFDEFAKIKAHHIMEEASDLVSDTLIDRGYRNLDSQKEDFASKLRKGPDGQVGVDIFVFDCEYYQKDPSSTEEMKQRTQQERENGYGAKSRVYAEGDARAIAVAASYALLEQDGWNMPAEHAY